MTSPDPPRLLRAGAPAADLLRGYARRTLPGERGTVAAWYRLRPRLEGVERGADADAGARAPSPRRWWRACSPSRVLTVALGLFVLVKLVPLAPALLAGAPAISERGVAGWSGIDGAGGMEGAGG